MPMPMSESQGPAFPTPSLTAYFQHQPQDEKNRERQHAETLDIVLQDPVNLYLM